MQLHTFHPTRAQPRWRRNQLSPNMWFSAFLSNRFSAKHRLVYPFNGNEALSCKFGHPAGHFPSRRCARTLDIVALWVLVPSMLVWSFMANKTCMVYCR